MRAVWLAINLPAKSLHVGMMKHTLPLSSGSGHTKKRKTKRVEIGSGEDILLTDVKSLLSRFASPTPKNGSTTEPSSESQMPFSRFDEIELEIRDLSALGM